MTRVVERLNYIAGNDRDQPRLFSKSGEDILLFNIETFEEKYGIVVAIIETLPAAARLKIVQNLESKVYTVDLRNLTLFYAESNPTYFTREGAYMPPYDF